MEEIKFRAWHKKLNIMCDVAAINFYHGNVVLLAMNEKQRKMFTEMNREALVECYDRLSVSMEEVILMQYANLNDTLDTEIYKGDILTDGMTNYIATFYTGAWRLERNMNGDKWYKSLYRYKCKVIGNIYENPELLKEEEKR